MSAGTEPREGREAIKIWGAVILLTAAGLIATYQFVGPPPPRRIVLATGTVSGAYHAFGARYRELLARHGLDVELRPTQGSVENLALLERGEVDVAFAQGGTAPDPMPENLVGIASLYYEPLWIFVRRGLEIGELNELAAKRIDVGPPGSGTRMVALDLLRENGVDEVDAVLSGLGSTDAAARVRAGELDAMFIVASPESSVVRELVLADGVDVTLFDLRRAETYVRLKRYLRRVSVSEGLFDLARNVPNREVRLVSPTAQLVGTTDLHHAVIPLLIEASKDIFASGHLFEEEGEFPSPRSLDPPIARAAEHYFVSGRSFLYRVLPFHIAAALDRLKILLLPLVTLLFPLFKVAPPLYRWRIRSKIYRWYKVLRGVEQEVRRADAGVDRGRLAADLARIETEINEVKVPSSYMEEFYNLRMHLDRVKESLIGRAT